MRNNITGSVTVSVKRGFNIRKTEQGVKDLSKIKDKPSGKADNEIINMALSTVVCNKLSKVYKKV